MPVCGKCGDSVFLTAPAVLAGASKDTLFVYCRNCHAVVGVIDSDTNGKLDKIINALRIIANKLGIVLSL